MCNTKLDELRHLVAQIGARQIELWQKFPIFADRLVKEFGNYLGDPCCVALCSADGEFSFDHIYKHEGLGFENGRFRIPLMIRIKNLKDEGDLQVRIRLYLTAENEVITASIDDVTPLKVDEADLQPLLEYIYEYMKSIFEHGRWFQQADTNYSIARIGFISNKM